MLALMRMASTIGKHTETDTQFYLYPLTVEDPILNHAPTLNPDHFSSALWLSPDQALSLCRTGTHPFHPLLLALTFYLSLLPPTRAVLLSHLSAQSSQLSPRYLTQDFHLISFGEDNNAGWHEGSTTTKSLVKRVFDKSDLLADTDREGLHSINLVDNTLSQAVSAANTYE